MGLLDFLRHSPLHERTEKALQEQLRKLRARRRQRFRVLVSLKDEETLYPVRMAARIADCPTCDIILLFVRPVDRDSGMHMKVARQNMLEAGVELPGLRVLRKGLEVLQQELGLSTEECEARHSHMDAWGDPVGDNKVSFTCPDGRELVLKLKVAPDITSGILDQYELGPYNLIILGEPVRWKKSGIWVLFHHVVAERILALAPCSVMVARNTLEKSGFFIYLDGSARSYNGMRRTAVLACEAGEPITLFAVAEPDEDLRKARRIIDKGRKILSDLGIPVQATKAARGKVVEEIIRHGNDHLVIAITDRGRSRLQRILFGSIAAETARRAATSVLDVRLG